MSDVFAEIADLLLGGKAPDKSTATHVKRAKVSSVSPLTFTLMDGSDTILDEDDDDVEIADAVDTATPAVGDVLTLQQDEHGDYIAVGILKRSS